MRPTEPSKLRASLDGDEVVACPYCDSTAVTARHPDKNRPSAHGDIWVCDGCGESTEHPEVREQRGSGNVSSATGQMLLEADPDEVFGD